LWKNILPSSSEVNNKTDKQQLVILLALAVSVWALLLAALCVALIAFEAYSLALKMGAVYYPET
jgi:hypothetical protein